MNVKHARWLFWWWSSLRRMFTHALIPRRWYKLFENFSPELEKVSRGCYTAEIWSLSTNNDKLTKESPEKIATLTFQSISTESYKKSSIWEQLKFSLSTIRDWIWHWVLSKVQVPKYQIVQDRTGKNHFVKSQGLGLSVLIVALKVPENIESTKTFRTCLPGVF